MTSTQSTQVLDIGVFKLRLQAVPRYDGNPETLNNFIYSCTRLMKGYTNITQETHDIVLEQIQAKLIDRAALQLGAKTFNTWEAFKAELLSSFSLGKDLNNYRDDIINARKHQQESILDFAYRVRNLFDLLTDYLHSQNLSAQEKTTISKECENLVINNIIHHCPYDLQRHFFTSKPTQTSEVISEIQRDNSFKALHNNHTISYQKLMQPSQRQNYLPPRLPPKRIENRPVQNLQNHPHQNPRTPEFRPRIPNFNQYQSWNRPPLPPRRPQPFQNPISNQKPQYSGRYRNENVFRPNQITNLPKPTPMDMSSQQRLLPRPQYNNNHYNGYNNNHFNKPRAEVHNYETPEDFYDPSYEPYYDQQNDDPYFTETEHYDQYEQNESVVNQPDETENFPIDASENNITN